MNHQSDRLQSLLKCLVDKNQQKRNTANKDLQTYFKNTNDQQYKYIQKFIDYLKQSYIKISDSNKKKTGLQALKTVLTSMKTNTPLAKKYMDSITDIIIQSLSQQDPKIRLLALKSLQQICQALESQIFFIINKIFQNLISKNASQQDQQTTKQIQVFDSYLQYILCLVYQNNNRTFGHNFDLKSFMNIIKSKFKSTNPHIRLFLIQWINILTQFVPVQSLQFIPDVFEQLLLTLGQKDNLEVLLIEHTVKCVQNFKNQLGYMFHKSRLQDVLTISTINQILTILIKIMKGKTHSTSKIYALQFIRQFTIFFKSQLDLTNKNNLLTTQKYFKNIIIQRFDQILQPILILMSSEESDIQKISFQINFILIQCIPMINKQQQINFSKVIPLLKSMLIQKKFTVTSQHVLQWIKFMLQNYNDKIILQVNDIIEKLVQKLCQSNQSKSVIKIIQNTKITKQYYQKLISKMLVFIKNKNNIIHQKVTINNINYQKIQFILKKFSTILDSIQFCKTLTHQLTSTFSQNHQYIFDILQHLTQIIITQKSMQKIRKKLHQNTDQQFFTTLFTAFKYNPSSTICLCFLSQQYQLAYNIISTLGNQIEIAQHILIGICKVVTLIQLPGFLCTSYIYIVLRLAMLNYLQKPYLIQTLYAILMILPQGKIFDILKNRLQISKIPLDKFINNKNKIYYHSSHFHQFNHHHQSYIDDSANNNLLQQFLQCQRKFVGSNK